MARLPLLPTRHRAIIADRGLYFRHQHYFLGILAPYARTTFRLFRRDALDGGLVPMTLFRANKAYFARALIFGDYFRYSPSARRFDIYSR